MNYLRKIFTFIKAFFRPIFQNLKNSMPVLITLFLIALFVAIWTYGDSWTFDLLAKNSSIDASLKKYVTFSSRLAVTVFILLLIAMFFTYRLIIFPILQDDR